MITNKENLEITKDCLWLELLNYCVESIEKRLRDEENVNQIGWSSLRVIISRGLPEKPINVLIPKEILRILSEGNIWNIWVE